jgi:hypothetical protein
MCFDPFHSSRRKLFSCDCFPDVIMKVNDQVQTVPSRQGICRYAIWDRPESCGGPAQSTRHGFSWISQNGMCVAGNPGSCITVSSVVLSRGVQSMRVRSEHSLRVSSRLDIADREDLLLDDPVNSMTVSISHETHDLPLLLGSGQIGRCHHRIGISKAIRTRYI